jgi:hypothetical protein
VEESLLRAHGALVFVTAQGIDRWAGEEYAAMLSRVHASRGDPRPFLIPVVHGPEPELPPFLASRMRCDSSDIAGICDAIFKALGHPTGDKPPLGTARPAAAPLEISLALSREGDDLIVGWGELQGRTRLPIAEAELLRAELRARGTLRDARQQEHAAAAMLSEIGRRLGQVFVGGLHDALTQAVAEAQAEREIVVYLRADDPGLLALPWEAVTLPGHDFALGVAPRMSVIREIVTNRAPLVRAIDGPLRILVAVAAPDDDLDTARASSEFFSGRSRVTTSGACGSASSTKAGRRSMGSATR